VKLWHYTCADAAPLIAADGFLLPNPVTALRLPPLSWATDLDPSDVPDLDLALGLRGAHARCDRTAYRFEVLDVDAFEPWTTYAHRERVPWQVRHVLDGTPGGLPRHWHVARRSARVVVPA
jgi:hypothetical protein